MFPARVIIGSFRVVTVVSTEVVFPSTIKFPSKRRLVASRVMLPALEEILEPLITISPMLARGKPVLRYVSLIADTKLEVSTVTRSALDPTLDSTLNSSEFTFAVSESKLATVRTSRVFTFAVKVF